MSFLQDFHARRAARQTAVSTMLEAVQAVMNIYPPDKVALGNALRKIYPSGQAPDEKIITRTADDIAKLLETYPDDILQRIERLLGRCYDQIQQHKERTRIFHCF